MRRILFVVVALVMLFSLAATAFADGPAPNPGVTGPYYTAELGEVWFHYYGEFIPGERVDAWMYRPDTFPTLTSPTGWPQDWIDQGWPVPANYWVAMENSLPRRQSWPTDQYADIFGYYFTAFMLPRDEAWYPCSFPLKWKCNYWINPTTIEYHSPVDQTLFDAGLVWPWAVNPMDTIQPVEIWLTGYTSGTFWWIPFVIDGYYWKYTDINF